MAAAAVLAGEAPDDFRRRIIARPAFVYAHEFLRWARCAKNDLKRLPNRRHAIRRIEPMLTRFARHDYGPYEAIRHRIAAHRQPIGDTSDGSDELATAAAWLDISDATVRILADDARTVWNALAEAYDMPRLTSFPPVTPELRQALDETGFEPAPEGLVPGVGSFDVTRPDALWVRQGGDIGRRQRELVDAIRSVQVLSRLLHATATHEPYWRVNVAAVAAETSTLVELLYEQPPGTSPEHRRAPLLELVRHQPGAEALPILEAGLAALDRAALAHVRGLRNAIGAHVDDDCSVADLMSELEAVDLAAFDTVLRNCFDAISRARAEDALLATLAMADRTMADLRRIGDPPGLSY